MIFRPKSRFQMLALCGVLANAPSLALAAHVLTNTCLGGINNVCFFHSFNQEPNLTEVALYDTSEIDSQIASLRAQLQTTQGGVETQLTQFNQAAERRISEAVAKILIVNDPDRPTEIQQPLIRTIQQIVRQEVQRSLQQTQ